jgi:hypothetical protein
MFFFYFSQLFLYIVLVTYLYFCQKLTDVYVATRAIKIQYFSFKQKLRENNLEKEIAKTMLNRKKYAE